MKKTITAALIAGAATAALMGAGTANADVYDVAFVTVLEKRGITATSDASLIRLGHAACVSIAKGLSPVTVAKQLYAGSELSQSEAGYFVGASISAYCPQYSSLTD